MALPLPGRRGATLAVAAAGCAVLVTAGYLLRRYTEPGRWAVARAATAAPTMAAMAAPTVPAPGGGRTADVIRGVRASVEEMQRRARGLAAGLEPVALTAIQAEGQCAVAGLRGLADLVLPAGPAGATTAHAERLRLARELHDRASQAVGAMVVQAGAAQALRRPAPDRAQQAAAALPAAAVEALCQLDLLAWLVEPGR